MRRPSASVLRISTVWPDIEVTMSPGRVAAPPGMFSQVGTMPITFTGACVIALGGVVSGLFANDQKLADEIDAAADDAWDRVWQLPLWEEYQEQLRSNFADMANIGGRPGGSITAASFLARFTRKMRWAHLDIAGTAWKSGREKGSTGRPVPLLVRYALRHAGRK